MTILAILLAASLGSVKPDTFVVDTSTSVVHWKGTKFFGLGKHEGVVRLNSGHLVLGPSASGRFVVDMRSIEVTDIPPHEPVPRNRLRNHLMNEDFFDVARFPTATFDLRGVQRIDAGFRLAAGGAMRFRLVGDLTMRGVTRPITVDVDVRQSVPGIMRARSTFQINRHEWGVSFRGSRLTNDLVDDNIHFSLDFLLTPRRRS